MAAAVVKNVVKLFSTKLFTKYNRADLILLFLFSSVCTEISRIEIMCIEQKNGRVLVSTEVLSIIIA